MLLREFTHGRRKLCGASLVCAIVLAATNGLSVLLLIPLLQLSGTTSAGSGPGEFSEWTSQFISATGVTPTFTSVLCLFVSVVSLQGGLLYFKSIVDGKLTHGFCRKLRNDLYSSLNSASRFAQIKYRTADVAHALSAETERIHKGVTAALVLTGNLLFLIGLLTVSVLIAPKLATAAVLVCALFWPLLSFPNRLMRRSGQKLTQRLRAFYRDVLEQLAGLKESKILNAEERHILEFRRLSDEIFCVGVDQQRALGLTNLVFAVGGAVSLCLMLFVSVSLFETPLPQLIAVTVAFGRLAPRLRIIHTNYQQILHALPALDVVCDLRDAFSIAKEQCPRDARETLSLQNDLTLRKVSFRYPSATHDAVCDTDLKIMAGKVTAIVGPSGSGKTTLADILLGLLTPDSGDILIDDVPVTPKLTKVLRNSTAYVPQEPFLLHDTIRENLRWSMPDATETEMTEALQQAAVDLNTDRFSNGLDTIVGERGAGLSGGECQRITLARALLRKPSILILDEATSSMDSPNRNRVLETIENLRGRVTIILIAHAASTVRCADHIVVLDAGRVHDQGTWECLRSRSLLFRELTNLVPLPAAG